MKIQYQIVEKNGLNPFVEQLRLIEKKIRYPLEDGNISFFIDHGEKYSPFFTQQGFKTRFLIILDYGEVIGSIVAVWKKGFFGGEKHNALAVRKSCVSSEDIYKGDKILRKSISFKRPGTGISPFLLFKFLNKKAKKFIPKDTILKLNDFK